MFKLIYKRPNISSFQEIKLFQKEQNIKKIGHSGTLDLLAQGLLLIATDEDTKLLPYLKNKDKEYYVKVKLGEVSKTYDAEGPINFFSNKIPTLEEIEKTLNNFIGEQIQHPPIFSAKKINGKKAYELARKNKLVNLNPIKIKIYKIENIKYRYPYLEFNTLVSNGAYIRSLVNDLGIALNTGAYLTYLERTMVNGLKINDEINLEKLLNLKFFTINSIDELKQFFYGLIKKIHLVDDDYLLRFSDEHVGIIGVKNENIIFQKLFGNKIKSLLKDTKQI